MSNQESSVRDPAILTVCSSWDDVREALEPGEVLHVDKHTLPHPTRVGLQRAKNTIQGWTFREVFCDSRKSRSLRVYDHGHYFRATVVKHNPDSGLVGAAFHALSDAPTKTALALSIGFGVYQTVRSQETHERQRTK